MGMPLPGSTVELGRYMTAVNSARRRAGVAGAQLHPEPSRRTMRGGPWGVSPQFNFFPTAAEQPKRDAQRQPTPIIAVVY
jgi:hypothetical protein